MITVRPIRRLELAPLLLIFIFFCNVVCAQSINSWHLTDASKELVNDKALLAQMKRAVDAAVYSGSNPTISGYQVKSATVIATAKGDKIFVAGNSEYEVPEAIHSESSLLASITSAFGASVTRSVKFIAFDSVECSKCTGCGDCRDYIKSQTDYENLLIVCGQRSDKSIHVTRFKDGLVDETEFASVNHTQIALSKLELEELLSSAQGALQGGIKFFSNDSHSAAAGLSYDNNIYRAAGVDDAAFHYRYPISGLLQQAATEQDYLIKAIVVVGTKGQWPKISYRDRQYGYEFSLFNNKLNKKPIQLILSDGLGNYRLTSFEQALPYAFSLEWLIPKELNTFIEQIS
ncbi:MAG: hypothetical protein HOI53_07930 [Francisellaceae bacterium]|jgi:cytidine deaminase|nr:hypothetical protein [Francisellaceae bacterium]MBT6207943.1 hypothetical protein [Francisellaceae bacterium]MBT6539576.1 hypothetical protein [Francisellaceae bacterium]